jgi:hypothetical protein
VVAINLADEARHLDLAGEWEILVSSDDATADRFTGLLLAEQALLLAPRV